MCGHLSDDQDIVLLYLFACSLLAALIEDQLPQLCSNIDPKFLLFISANNDIPLLNRTFDMCNFSNGPGRKQRKTIFVTEESTYRQERASLLVGYSFLKMVCSVFDRCPLLTASVNQFSFLATCLILILIPRYIGP